MSTRCQIGFYEEEEKDLSKFEALLYRHSDGYPDTEYGVVAAVLPFLKWWANGRGVHDFEYCAARLLQYLCNEYDGRTASYRNEANSVFAPETPEEFTGTLGHGISKHFHGDIEYLYAIRPSRVEVYEVGDMWNAESDSEINKCASLQKVVMIADISNDRNEKIYGATK